MFALRDLARKLIGARELGTSVRDRSAGYAVSEGGGADRDHFTLAHHRRRLDEALSPTCPA